MRTGKRTAGNGGGQGFAEVSKARLGKAQSPEMLEYVWTPYADIDEENVRAMVRCNMAHTAMLYEQRILTKKEAGAILGALKKLEKRTADFPFDPVKGDQLSYQVNGTTVNWNFGLELKKVED